MKILHDKGDKVEERNKLYEPKVAWKGKKKHKENEEGDVKRKRNERENDEEMKFGANKIRRDDVWEKYQGKKYSKI